MHATPFYLFLFVTAATVWALSLTAPRLKSFVAPPLVIVVTGIALSFLLEPQANMEELLSFLETLSWLAVGFGVASIAFRLRGQDVRRLWRPGAMIIGVAMLGMWCISGAVIAILFDVPFAVAALIGAIVTPTDPIVASSIVTGPFAERHVPARVRQMLSFESGANDGLGYAFVFLPILFIQHGDAAWSRWLLDTCLWGILASGVMGAAGGWLAGTLFRRILEPHQMDERSVMLASMGLTGTLLSLMKLAGVDSIWAAFVAGLVFAALLGDAARNATDQYEEGGNYLVMVPALLLFGMVLPWSEWAGMWEAGLTAAVGILLLRRLPVMAVLFAALRAPAKDPTPGRDEQERDGIDPRTFRARRDFWFYGWFGPLGLSAIYYATTAHRLLDNETIWHVASLLIFTSIVAHGLTAAPFTRWYGRAAKERS